MRNLPVLVNFRIWLSSFALPLSQTLSLSSTKIPCSVVNHSYPAPGPPHAWRNLPLGVELQHRTARECSTPPAAELSDAAFSPSGMLAGRWNTQTLSCESTATPPTGPVTHLFGSACDHSGSGSKSGTCWRVVWAFPALSNTVATAPSVATTSTPAPHVHIVVFIRRPLSSEVLAHRPGHRHIIRAAGRRFRGVSMIRLPAAIASLAVILSVVLSAQTSSHDVRAREIFKQLVEINTTHSVGSTTVAAEAMAVRLQGCRLPRRRRARARRRAAEGQPRRALSRHRREAAAAAARASRCRRGQARGLVVRSVHADREGRLLLRTRHGRRQDDGGGVRGQPDSSQVRRLRAVARHHPGADR